MVLRVSSWHAFADLTKFITAVSKLPINGPGYHFGTVSIVIAISVVMAEQVTSPPTVMKVSVLMNLACYSSQVTLISTFSF